MDHISLLFRLALDEDRLTKFTLQPYESYDLMHLNDY